MNPFEFSLAFNNRIIIHNIESSPLENLIVEILDSLSISARNLDKAKLALNCILSNVLIAYLNGYYLSVSKSRNDYSGYSWYGLKHYSYRIFVPLIDKLISAGFIEEAKGYFDRNNKGAGKRTRIWATDELISFLNTLSNTKIDFSTVNYKRPILLRDKDKNLIPYKCSKRICNMLRSLNEYNELISGCEIFFPVTTDTLFASNNIISHTPLELYLSLPHILLAETILSNDHPSFTNGIPLLRTIDPKLFYLKELDGQLYRVFNNGKFNEGGRFYGAAYQQLNENQRRMILFNNSPVVEVDFVAHHLNILYNTTGKEFENDPYSLVNGNSELRPLMKKVSLIAIDSIHKSQALNAIRYEMIKHPELAALKRKYNLNERELLRDFESFHFRISNYFYRGIGTRLQFLDSQIAESILKHFTQREIPCLCVHDSFLVPAVHKAELEEVMITDYKKRFGYDPKIK